MKINREELIAELRARCWCLVYGDDCSKCDEDLPILCRSERELFKASADMLEEDGHKVIETNIFAVEEVHHNCTVQILRNSVTGEQSIGWWPEEQPPREVANE